MNREIKFRAWLPCISKMTHAGTIEDITKWAPLGCTPIWLQYTGLKDKNGNEVYEGDVLKSAHSVPLQVIFEDGKFCFHNDHSTGADILSQMRTERLEIIGNIYQNPDLITK